MRFWPIASESKKNTKIPPHRSLIANSYILAKRTQNLFYIIIIIIRNVCDDDATLRAINGIIIVVVVSIIIIITTTKPHKQTSRPKEYIHISCVPPRICDNNNNNNTEWGDRRDDVLTSRKCVRDGGDVAHPAAPPAAIQPPVEREILYNNNFFHFIFLFRTLTFN